MVASTGVIPVSPCGAGEDQADRVIAFSQMCHVVPLDTATALAAADMCALHGLATADAIIYATARAHHAELLTCDAHFKGLDRVRYLPKP